MGRHRVLGSCQAKDCHTPASARNLCNKHYRIWYNSDDAASIRKTCSIDECNTLSIARGLCMKHYRRQRRAGVMDNNRVGSELPRTCRRTGCENPHCAKGLCRKHYRTAHAAGKTKASLKMEFHGEDAIWIKSRAASVSMTPREFVMGAAMIADCVLGNSSIRTGLYGDEASLLRSRSPGRRKE
jgi:hypothetical protein